MFWLIFWKGVVLAVWAATLERWITFKKRRKREGLPLQLNKRTGVHEVRDWTVTVDRAARWMSNGAMAFIFLIWTVLGAAFLYGGKDAVRAVTMWAFFSAH